MVHHRCACDETWEPAAQCERVDLDDDLERKPGERRSEKNQALK